MAKSNKTEERYQMLLGTAKQTLTEEEQEILNKALSMGQRDYFHLSSLPHAIELVGGSEAKALAKKIRRWPLVEVLAQVEAYEGTEGHGK